MTFLEGVDSSYDPLTDDEAKRLKAAGVESFTQCLWTGAESPGCAAQNLIIADRWGLEIAGYTSLNGHQGGRYHVDRAVGAVGLDLWAKLHHVFVDIELDGIPNAHIREAVERCVELGKQRAIYTSFNAWVSKQGNPKDFDDCLLWDANWNGIAWVPDAVLYGAWKAVVGRQYTGGQDVEGQFVDRDLFVRELFVTIQPEPPAQEDDDMKPFLCWVPDAYGGATYLVGPFGAAWITKPKDVTVLESMYGALNVVLSAATVNGIGRQAKDA